MLTPPLDHMQVLSLNHRLEWALDYNFTAGAAGSCAAGSAAFEAAACPSGVSGR
jgi:hypothetical protein